MFSKRTELRSIASQLVLLFTLAAAILLSCGLGVFYLLVVRHAFEEDNHFLADKVFALRGDLNTADWPSGLLAELQKQRAGESRTFWIRIIDSAGNIVGETQGMQDPLPASAFPPQNSNSAVLVPKSYQTKGKLFSLVTTTEQARGQTYTFQIAQDRSADAEFTRRFGALLGLVLALGIVASAIIATTLTRRGLRPLAEMTDAVQRVGPSRLNERLARTEWPKELHPLALAFDEMLARLEESFTRLSQFSADLAHELRTPVANLLGEAQVTLSRQRTLEEYRQVIESSVAECERLSGIIDNLLFLARADAAKDQIQRTHFDGRAAAENIAGYYQTVAEERQITIRCSGHGDVYADSTLFGRALSNLVENALRFTPAGGTIEIAIAMDPERCRFSVTDTGTGIAPEHLPHVFDRFYRADSSRSSDGAGLGLALVKSIAQMHAGSVTIQSEVNRGTTVAVEFPNHAGS